MFDANSQENNLIHARAEDDGFSCLTIAVRQVSQVMVLFDGVGLPYTIGEDLVNKDDELSLPTAEFYGQSNMDDR